MLRKISTDKEFLQLFFTKINKYPNQTVSKEKLESILYYFKNRPIYREWIELLSTGSTGIDLTKTLSDLETQFFLFLEKDQIEFLFTKEEANWIERNYSKEINQKMDLFITDYIYMSYFAESGKVPFSFHFENPNQEYALLQRDHLFSFYQELLTDGKTIINASQEEEKNHISVQVLDANFVIVRNKRFGKCQSGHLLTEVNDKVYLSYYNHLITTSYHKMEKVKPQVYRLIR